MFKKRVQSYLGIDPGPRTGYYAVVDCEGGLTEFNRLTDLTSLQKILQTDGMNILLEAQTSRGYAYTPDMIGDYLYLLGLITGMGLCFSEVWPDTWHQELSISRKSTGVSTNAKYKHKLFELAASLYPHQGIVLKSADAILIAHFNYLIHQDQEKIWAEKAHEKVFGND